MGVDCGSAALAVRQPARSVISTRLPSVKCAVIPAAVLPSAVGFQDFD